MMIGTVLQVEVPIIQLKLFNLIEQNIEIERKYLCPTDNTGTLENKINVIGTYSVKCKRV